MRLLRRFAVRVLMGAVVLGVVLGIALAIAEHFSPAGRAAAKKDAAAASASASASQAQVPVPPKASDTAPAPAAATPTGASGRVAGLARGCLGGTDASQAALAAQRDAALTPEGAAEFAAAIMRWGGQIPFPDASRAHIPQLMDRSAEGRDRVGQWPAAYAGATGYASFLQGRWYVNSFSKDDARISVTYKQVVELPQEGVKTQDGTTEVHLKAVNGHWVFLGTESNMTPEKMAVIGTPYSGGC